MNTPDFERATRLISQAHSVVAALAWVATQPEGKDDYYKVNDLMEWCLPRLRRTLNEAHTALAQFAISDDDD